MNKKLQHEFEALEKSRLALFAELDKLDASKMNTKPDENSWSVIQVMDHLTLAERNSVLYIKKKMSVSDKFKKANLNTEWRLFLLKAALKLPLKWKAPKVVADARNDNNYEQAKAAWNEVRNNLRELLETFPEEYLDSEIFKHPLAGKFTIVQALGFMQTHFNHHLGQFRRINKAVQ
ncbi:MAG: hypothetical protein POELPBGB_02427 [Bacteroidia bacterium]|nr:hypothetical protein [Bacteroidia bacterium]